MELELRYMRHDGYMSPMAINDTMAIVFFKMLECCCFDSGNVDMSTYLLMTPIWGAGMEVLQLEWTIGGFYFKNNAIFLESPLHLGHIVLLRYE